MFKFKIVDDHHILTPKLNAIIHKANKLISQQIKQQYIYDLLIINDKEMKAINKKYRQINKTTDVISFALHDAKSIKTLLLGEVYINYQQAQKTKNSSEYELIFLFIHGLLHLLGHDHRDELRRTKMFALQNKLMKQLNLLK
jgi:probable rRNA maturation factor